MMRFKTRDGLEFSVAESTPIIDDEMIARAVAAFKAKDGEWTTHEEQVRTVLEAALGLKPAYPITDDMLDAGNQAWNYAVGAHPQMRGRSSEHDKIMRAVYNAMRAAEEKK